MGSECEVVQLSTDGFFATPKLRSELLWSFARSVVLFQVSDGFAGPSLTRMGGFDGSRGSASGGALYRGGNGSGGDKAAKFVEVTSLYLTGQFPLDDAVRGGDNDCELDTALCQDVGVQAVATA